MSLSAQEVFTILSLPAMAQEHVLTAPLAEGNVAQSYNSAFLEYTLVNLCKREPDNKVESSCYPEYSQTAALHALLLFYRCCSLQMLC